MTTTIIRAEGNTYGYATITDNGDGTFTVDRFTDEPVRVMGCALTHQEQRTVLGEDKARALAAECAAVAGPARRPAAQHCHWCGQTLRDGHCPECGEQFQL